MVEKGRPPRCHFCGTKQVLLDGIGIAIDMGGKDYSFFEDCLRNNPAYKFWYNFFDTWATGFQARMTRRLHDASTEGSSHPEEAGSGRERHIRGRCGCCTSFGH